MIQETFSDREQVDSASLRSAREIDGIVPI